MVECVECGGDNDGVALVCDVCALTNVVEAAKLREEEVTDWADCPLCEGSGKCFFCSPGGPCYHCSGSGREPPGSEAECHICGGSGEETKGCDMCDHTRKCRHCDGAGSVPSSLLRG